jgi:hypothetical protein
MTVGSQGGSLYPCRSPKEDQSAYLDTGNRFSWKNRDCLKIPLLVPDVKNEGTGFESIGWN